MSKLQGKRKSCNGKSKFPFQQKIPTTRVSQMPRNGGARLGRKSNWETDYITDIELLPGDIICDKCSGKGWLEGKTDWYYNCDKCYGARKLDWVERIMGKANPFPKRALKANWTIEMEEDLVAIHDVNLESEIIDILAEELAEKVDEEIMGNIIELSVTKSKL